MLNRWYAWHRRASLRQKAIYLLLPAILVILVYAIRFGHRDIAEVVPGMIYRSAQPSVDQLGRWVERFGLKTVINLRGPNAPYAAQEARFLAGRDVDFLCISLSAYRRMTREELLRLIVILRSARPPMLIHCRSGVDRSGTASAIAAWLVGGQGYKKAKRQAYVPPRPWKDRYGHGHISDTLAMYEEYCLANDLDPNDTANLISWAEYAYCPAGLRTAQVPDRSQ